MADKAKWYGDGIYSRTRDGREVFYVRAWVPAQRRMRYAKIRARTIDEARERAGVIKADPEKFFAKRDARPVPSITFADLVKRFLAGYQSRGDSGYYDMVSISWLDHFDKVKADKVTRGMVEDYRDALRRDGYSDSTTRKYVGNLGTLYRWAKGRGIVADDPGLAWSRKAEGVTRPSEPDREVDVVTLDEQAKWEEAADPLTRNMIALFCESGMRAGGRGDGEEGLSLKWSQVDRASGTILIPKSKNGKARAIPLNARLTAVLGRVTRHVRSEYVLCDQEGEPLDYFRINRLLESALDRAGIRKSGGLFLLMRHTFGSRLAERGVSMGTIAKIMGNTAAVCERHYIRFSPAHLKAAMATLDAPTVAGSVADPRGVVESQPRNESEAVAS